MTDLMAVRVELKDFKKVNHISIYNPRCFLRIGGPTVPEIIISDYFYGDEAVQFTFFKMPRQLITDPKLQGLSADAKLLYGLLLDRVGLSTRNNWHDSTERIYIYYTIKEICGAISCGRNKAMRLLSELDTVKGIGLIERIKQGQGKPDKIFVKQIIVQKNTEKFPKTEQESTAPISEVDFSDVQRLENPTSRSRKNRRLEVSKTAPNKTDKNQTDFIQTNLSIYPQERTKVRLIDGYEQKEKKESELSKEQWVITVPLLCCLFLHRTSYAQNKPPGYSAQDNAVHGAVPASMSFDSTNDPC